MYKDHKHEIYSVFNICRLSIVGSSIAFFLIITLLDIVEFTGSCLNSINNQILACFDRILGRLQAKPQN